METSRRNSVVLWILLGAFLILTSYALTLALALACIALVLTGNLVLAIGGPILGLTIVWSLVPRRDNFEAPGPLLNRQGCPHLFAELDRIAADLKEDMPAEVYLLPDMNAWVAERGGLMGFGRRRVMGIGLPLLGALTVAEFRAVLAHEFAHYYRGDTRLGPWLYQARSGMIRTLKSLGEPNAILQVAARFLIINVIYRVVVFLLVGYWKLFLRATLFMSRKQEFRADELAAQIAGAGALTQGLRTIVGGEMAINSYWNSEVGPVISAGYHPPIAQGFASFLAAPAISKAVTEALDRRIREEKTEAFSSHPPLRDRIAKVTQLRLTEPSAHPEDSQPATSLVENLESLELELLRKLIPDLREKQLQFAAWEGLKSKVVVESWKKRVASLEPQLQAFTVETIPDALQNLAPIAAKIPDPPGMLLDPSQRKQRAIDSIAAALALVMIEQGWTLVATPGEHSLVREDVSVDPFELVSDLAEGKSNREAWLTRTSVLGIANYPLIKAAHSANA